MNRRSLLKSLASLGLLWQPLKQVAVAADAVSRSAKTAIVYHPDYLQHVIEPGHPESPERLRAVIQAIDAAGLRATCTSYPLMDSELIEQCIRANHTEQHISALQQRHPVSHTVLLQLLSDVLSATTAVCEGRISNVFCATRPPGHHAENTGRIEGFCLYNTVAIAARYAQQHHAIKKVLIIDWDYHHGNGTESAFYQDPSVLFFSTHDRYAYPGTGAPSRRGAGAGEGYNINVHLPCGATDEMMIAAFEKNLLPAAERFKPDLIFISAGFDSRADDRLGCFNVTDGGFAELTRLTRGLAERHCDGRIVSVMEGGYNIEGNASAAIAHIQALMA